MNLEFKTFELADDFDQHATKLDFFFHALIALLVESGLSEKQVYGADQIGHELIDELESLIKRLMELSKDCAP